MFNYKPRSPRCELSNMYKPKNDSCQKINIITTVKKDWCCKEFKDPENSRTLNENNE